MPRRLKKLESNEAPVSRAESVPGPSPEKKKVAAKVREALRSHQENAENDMLLDELSKPMEVKPAKRKPAKKSEEPTLGTFQKSFQKKYDAAYARFEEADARQQVNPSPENEAALEEARQEAEKQRIRLEKTNIRQEELDETKTQEVARNQVEQDREWSSRIQRSMAEDAERRRIIAESRKALEEYKKNQTKEEEEGYPVDIAVEEPIQVKKESSMPVMSEREQDLANPRLRNIMGKITKLEQDQSSAAQRLHDLTGMSPEDAYEKLVLNGGAWARIKRGLASLANVPTYKVLDEWNALGRRLEVLYAELKEKRNTSMAVEREASRDLANDYRLQIGKKPIEERQAPPDVDELAEAAVIRDEIAENPTVESDYKQGIVRDAEGNIITDEKKIRAKRPESRIKPRKISTGTPTIAEATSSRIGSIEPIDMPPSERMSDAEVGLAVEARKYQESRAAEINVVRREYPRAAELWNSISKRLISMDNEQIQRLRAVFNTTDVATAYVIDRAFYDMDGDQESKARVQKADKILGIEEMSPKKPVRQKVSKKAA